MEGQPIGTSPTVILPVSSTTLSNPPLIPDPIKTYTIADLDSKLKLIEGEKISEKAIKMDNIDDENKNYVYIIYFLNICIYDILDEIEKLNVKYDETLKNSIINKCKILENFKNIYDKDLPDKLINKFNKIHPLLLNCLKLMAISKDDSKLYMYDYNQIIEILKNL
jgi:hypothetical protein